MIFLYLSILNLKVLHAIARNFFLSDANYFIFRYNDNINRLLSVSHLCGGGVNKKGGLEIWGKFGGGKMCGNVLILTRKSIDKNSQYALFFHLFELKV